jgi:hypothetical protein
LATVEFEPSATGEQVKAPCIEAPFATILEPTLEVGVSEI